MLGGCFKLNRVAMFHSILNHFSINVKTQYNKIKRCCMDAEVRIIDYQSFGQLKHIRDILRLEDNNQLNVLTKICMHVTSGVNSHHLVRIMPMLLHKIIQLILQAFVCLAHLVR